MIAQDQSLPSGDFASPHPLEALRGLHLMVGRNLEVVGASEAYLKMTQMPRLRTAGTSVLQILPDPVIPGSNLSLAMLQGSFDRVLKAASPDSVAFTCTEAQAEISRISVINRGGLGTAPLAQGAPGPRNWMMTNTPLLDGDGAVIFILHSLSDVTALSQPLPQPALIAGRNEPVRMEALDAEAEKLILENELRESENRFHDLLEGASDAVMEVGGDGRILFANTSAVEMFGYTLDELLEHDVESLVVPKGRREAHRQHRENYSQHPHMRRMGTGIELSARRKDDTIFPVEISLIPIQSQGQSKVITIIHDITARKRTEEKLRQAQKLEALGRLAGGTAHEFNNLLAVIMGSAELLLDSEDEKAKHVERIRKAAMRAGGLSRQLLTFGRKQLLSVRILDLNQLLSDISASLSDVAPGCEIECELLPVGQPLWIKADRLMMEQVVTNLITNAREAMPKGGKIKLSTRSVDVTTEKEHNGMDLTPGRYSLLCVKDTGIGMTPEVQARLFEPFFTLKGLAATPGMGLAMAYGMVTQGGGTISVKSKPGAGTTFSIYLPRPADHELQEAANALPPLVSAACGETILVLDDQTDLLLLTTEFLRQIGYHVLAAERPSDALRISATFNNTIDLLITDVIMPGMGGHEFARQFRISRPDVPVLYISGYTDEIFEGVELGPQEAFLAKPFLTEELALTIRELLQRVKPAISS